MGSELSWTYVGFTSVQFAHLAFPISLVKKRKHHISFVLKICFFLSGVVPVAWHVSKNMCWWRWLWVHHVCPLAIYQTIKLVQWENHKGKCIEATVHTCTFHVCSLYFCKRFFKLSPEWEHHKNAFRGNFSAQNICQNAEIIYRWSLMKLLWFEHFFRSHWAKRNWANLFCDVLCIDALSERHSTV